MLIVDPPTAEVGAVYEGRVVNITKFGAFVSILPGRDGLVHISKLGAGKRIDKVEDVLELGQPLTVIVEDVDPNGKISLKPAGDGPAASSKDEAAGGSDAPATAPDQDDSSDDDDAPVDSFEDDVNDGDYAGGGDNFDEDDSFDDDDAPVVASFEDAFKAELETVHGDLGAAAPTNRGGGGGGGRRRRR
jgi:polyribonucleotide nucleotidyltransferase